MLNDCDEATVEYVGDGHGLPVLDLTDENVASEKGDCCKDLCDSNAHQEGSEANEEDIAEQKEGSQPPLRPSRRVERTPL